MTGRRKPDHNAGPGALRVLATVVRRLARIGHLPAQCPAHAFEDAIIALDEKGLIRKPPAFVVVDGRKRWLEAEKAIGALSTLNILAEAPGAIPCIDEETDKHLRGFEVPDLFADDEEVDRILRTFLPRLPNPANGKSPGFFSSFGWLMNSIFGD